MKTVQAFLPQLKMNGLVSKMGNIGRKTIRKYDRKIIFGHIKKLQT